MKKKKGMTRKPIDRIDLRFNSYIQNSVQYNTRQQIQETKKKSVEYDVIVKKHMFTFNSVEEELIGSQFFTLLYQARFEPENYQYSRLGILKDIYMMVSQNNWWRELWQTFSDMEHRLFERQTVLEHQLLSELYDMMRLHARYPNWITGINGNKPMFTIPPFYLTRPLLTYIENGEKGYGRKKIRQLNNMKYQAMEFAHYLSASYGLYDPDTIDLIAVNGVNYETIPEMKLPRKIADMDPLCDFIQANQRYTMNPYGIVIDCYNAGDIKQITMVEKGNHILWHVQFGKPGWVLDKSGMLTDDLRGAEYSGTFDKRGGAFLPRSLFTVHSTYIDFEYDIYTFVLECYADVVCGSDALSRRFRTRKVQNMGAVLMNEEISATLDSETIGLRYTPRTVHKKAKQKATTKDALEREIQRYFVSGHIRRLPDGFNASDEAVAHAAEYGIELPSNTTFVRPYEAGDEKIRTHYIKRVD